MSFVPLHRRARGASSSASPSHVSHPSFSSAPPGTAPAAETSDPHGNTKGNNIPHFNYSIAHLAIHRDDEAVSGTASQERSSLAQTGINRDTMQLKEDTQTHAEPEQAGNPTMPLSKPTDKEAEQAANGEAPWWKIKVECVIGSEEHSLYFLDGPEQPELVINTSVEYLSQFLPRLQTAINTKASSLNEASQRSRDVGSSNSQYSKI